MVMQLLYINIMVKNLYYNIMILHYSNVIWPPNLKYLIITVKTSQALYKKNKTSMTAKQGILKGA